MSPPERNNVDGTTPPALPSPRPRLRLEAPGSAEPDAPPTPTILVPDVPPGPDAPAGVAVREAVAAALRRLIEHEPDARAGGDEGVHQMRVATRRLRSDLRTFRDLVEDAWARPLRAELKWLADLLGAVRDLDVLLARLKAEAEGARPKHRAALVPVWEELEARRDDARRALMAALDGARYRGLRDAMAEGARAPALTPAALGPCAVVLPALVKSTWKALAEAGRRLRRDDPDEALHEVRIRAKRARYAAEAVAGSLGDDAGAQAAKFARAASRLQEILGEHQDAVIARAVASGAAGDRVRERDRVPGLKGAVAEIVRAQDRAARAARRAFRAAWHDLDRKKRRAWMG
jgi:CHAD domain-containing protein